MKRLRPVLDGDWWLIGPSPDLAGLLPGTAAHKAQWEAGGRKTEHNAPVDHHIVRSADGRWHLWGCVRATAACNTLMARALGGRGSRRAATWCFTV